MSFQPGIDLCRRFYLEAVQPLLTEETPHAAGLLGGGSDVLGFDTPMSMDHDWGPRVQLFFTDLPTGLTERLAARLPRTFAGIPVFVGYHDDGSSHPEAEGIDHRVTCTTWPEFRAQYLGLSRDPDPVDWLRLPQQKLRTLSTGPIFHDEIGLDPKRDLFSWYPNDVWRYLLACQWQRIGQEEHLVGRAGFVGDELGAKLIAGRLVRDAMRIAFLLEREYAPYPKWFGTAFRRLRAANALTPLMEHVLRAEGWEARDTALARMYETLAEFQNEARLCDPRPAQPKPFFGRPFSVIELHAEFAESLIAAITDSQVKSIAAHTRAGSVDQISDNTDVLERAPIPLREIWNR